MIFPKPGSGLQRDDLIILSENTTLENTCAIGCIFYSEFDNQLGPTIRYEVPENKFTSTGIFDQIASFIITKPDLTSHQLTATIGQYKILGYPVQILDPKKYSGHRNALLFNLCLVFKNQENIDPYEPVVKKLGEYLRTVEVETSYLSNPVSKATLPDLMSKILADLNSLGRCSIRINKSNTLYLKVVPPDANTGNPVHDCDVPVLESDEPHANIILGDDLTTRQVVPLIDGRRNVHQISEDVDADGDLVKSCVQNMIYYGIAKVVPRYDESNIYRTTPAIRRFVADSAMQKHCVNFVARDEKDPPSLRDIMIIFGDMQHGVPVKNWLARHSGIAQKVDQKKLCDFGVMHGFIRRVYKYPVYLKYNAVTANSATVMRFFNGTFHTDDIRIKNDIAGSDLDEKIDADHFICVCWK